MALRAFRASLATTVIVTGLAVLAAVATAAIVTVKSTQNSSLGTILITASGRTLYHDSAETKNVVKCTGACAKQWPPLLVTSGAKAIASPGVTASMLGTVKRPDGTVQVTYHGLPLYLFAGDKKAGDVNGQGEGGIWHAIAPSGTVVTKSVKASTGSTTTKSSGSGTTTTPSSSTGAGATTTSPSTGAGTPAATTPSDCAANPGDYGCM